MSSTLHLKVPVIILTFLITACSENKAPKKEQATVTTETDDRVSSSDQDFMLPQPISLVHALKNAGLTYATGKTNPVSKKDSYSKKVDQLLNLGVYTTDLAYCAINNKTQEARDYLSAIQNLGSKVGLESIFSDKAMIKRFDQNLGNQEAIEELIYEIQEKSDSYMEDNDLRYLAAVEFAGAWVEGMYLGIDKTISKQDALGVALVDQMNLLKNTIKGLEGHPSQDARLKEVTASFQNVLKTYEGLASVQKANKNINFEAPVLTPEEFKVLTDKIVALRTSITSPVQK